jgi:GxxExxY protein
MDRITLRNEDEINALTHKIIGCAMQVHSALGNGFQEVIYQRAPAIELSYQGLNFAREVEMDLFYRNQPIGTRRVEKIQFFLRQ